MRRRGMTSTRKLAVCVALGLTVASWIGTAPAGASPQDDLASATAQAEKLDLQIQANSARADMLDERYLQARRAVTIARKQVARTEQQIGETEASVAHLRGQLAGRAARLYMRIGNADPIGLSVASVQDLGERAQYGNAAAEDDLRVLELLRGTQARLDRQRADLGSQLAAAQHKERSARKARDDVERANASMSQLLESTNAQIRLLAAGIEQQQIADVAAAQRAWMQREAARQAEAARSPHGHVGAAPPDVGAPPDFLPTPGAGALKAVAYARAQLGKPYVYAGAGPDVFDCSGLTMMAWLQGGVLMEHGSQAQYDAFPHVPIDELQPGDLVFFGDTGPTNHHVGIVVGPGLMIDAPHTGAFVELVSYFRPDLVPLGARPTPTPTRTGGTAPAP